MGTIKDTPGDSELRQRVEKELEIAAGSTEAFSEMSPGKMASLIHELQVHQIELKMQNEELRRTQDELEKTRDRYAELYDFAPIGYLSVNQKGVIDEANLTIASMLGVERGALIGQPFTRFVLGTDQDTFYKHREEVLTRVGKKLLKALGYPVTATTSGTEALALFKDQPDQFDLVMTDTNMPNMPGDILARELMKIRPDIPVIISTGLSKRMSEEKAKEMGIKAFVMKPLSMRVLAETVRRVLDESKAASRGFRF